MSQRIVGYFEKYTHWGFFCWEHLPFAYLSIQYKATPYTVHLIQICTTFGQSLVPCFPMMTMDILAYFWSRKPELTCGPGFPRMPGNPGGPGMPCPMGTQHIKTKTDRQTMFRSKKQTHDLFSKETDRHARFLLFSHQVGPLCSVMLQRLDFACTQIQLRIK